jgi:hypothetical protein
MQVLTRRAFSCLINICFSPRYGCSIKDKEGDTALDLVQKDDKEILTLIKRALLEASMSPDDVANGARIFPL